MATAYVEPPDTAWGTIRRLTVVLKALGYHVDEDRYLGTGEVRLLLS